jgi:hypothetical protein
MEKEIELPDIKYTEAYKKIQFILKGESHEKVS